VSPASIRIAILDILSGVQPYALPQPQLLSDVNGRVRPQLSLPDLVRELSWLKARELIAYLPDALAPDDADARRWLITEAGLAALKR
jgi:hypothetical protein